MSASALSAVIRRAGAGTDEPDAVLLERFTTAGDQAAFAELVRRYARLVWALCRHSRPCEADADDAFQATFLALARHAGSVRDPHRLGPWLHTVAVRVCKNARREVVRRTRREAGAAVSERSHPVADSAWDAASAAVHEEVAKLPAAHRVAFVLCVLEGKTPTAAAAQLGLPVGTVGAHLHRAKERLLKRLAARGLGAAVAFATLLDTPPATAVERALTVAQTPSAAMLFLLSGAVPMALPHAKLLLVLAVLTAGLVGLLLPTAAQDPHKATPSKTDKPAAKLDLHGDPLPDKAIMRLGTVKYRMPDIAGVGFKKTGELVVLNDRLELYTYPADGGANATVTPFLPSPLPGRLSRVDISADARFAAAHAPGEPKKPWKVVVWDISGAKPVEHLSVEMPLVNRLALSPNGRWLVVCGEGGEDPVPVQLCDLTTKKWKPVAIPPKSGYVERIAFNVDGKRLSVVVNDTARVFDTASGELLANVTIPNARLDAAEVSPDGKAMAALPGTWLYGKEQELRLLTVADGKPVDGWTNPKVNSRSVGFVPGGKTLWTLGGGKLREWDPAAGKWVREATVPLDQMYVPGPVWSPDGKRFAVFNQHAVALMDADTWKPLHAEALAAGPTDAIFGITVSPDGKTIATDGNDVHLWDAATGKLLGSVKATWGNESMLAFLPDSKSFLTIADHQFPIECDARTGKELRRFKLPDDLFNKVTLRNLRLSADGKTLETFAQSASSQWKSARLRWDVAKGEVSGRGEADERERDEELFFGTRSPDGTWRAGGHVVSRTDGSEKPVEVFPQTERALNSSAAWSPDSKRVAIPRAAGKTPEDRQQDKNLSVVVFDVTTKKTVAEVATGRVMRSAFSNDGRLLAVLGHRAVTVWNVDTGKEVFRAACDGGTIRRARAITFTPDGQRLITGHDTHALVWDVSAATAK